jgi:predicted Fe-S protein YdhL (DUF1289 family)
MSDAKKSSSGKTINSPCVSICALNEDDVCVGCYRTGNEISHWGTYDNDKRLGVLKLAFGRAKAVNPFMN